RRRSPAGAGRPGGGTARPGGADRLGCAAAAGHRVERRCILAGRRDADPRGDADQLPGGSGRARPAARRGGRGADRRLADRRVLAAIKRHVSAGFIGGLPLDGTSRPRLQYRKEGERCASVISADPPSVTAKRHCGG
ncbi:hypothetical protein, partial [Paenibacillus dendritiformis]|uniref:hypothetical protein n=1 Tax=Paenibacillus dendritiformis TaxID=130049 RepID=UPI001C65A9F0